jgi:hypothetical protein
MNMKRNKMNKLFIVLSLLIYGNAYSAAYLPQAIQAEDANLIAQIIVGASLSSGKIYEKAMKVAGVAAEIEKIRKKVSPVSSGVGAAKPAQLSAEVAKLATSGDQRDQIEAFGRVVGGKGSSGADVLKAIKKAEVSDKKLEAFSKEVRAAVIEAIR